MVFTAGRKDQNKRVRKKKERHGYEPDRYRRKFPNDSAVFTLAITRYLDALASGHPAVPPQDGRTIRPSL